MRLTNLIPTDVEWVDRTLDDCHCTQRWSLHGRTPPRAAVWDLLWRGVALQQTLRDDGGHPLALLQLTDVDLTDGVADVAVLAAPSLGSSLAPTVAAFVGRVFRELPLRKITVAAVAGELDVPGCFGPWAELSGRLVQHVRRGADTYADVDLYEIWSGAE